MTKQSAKLVKEYEGTGNKYEISIDGGHLAIQGDKHDKPVKVAIPTIYSKAENNGVERETALFL